MKYVVVITGVRGRGLPEYIGAMVREEYKVSIYDTIELALKFCNINNSYLYEPKPINRKTCAAIRGYKGTGPVRYIE